MSPSQRSRLVLQDAANDTKDLLKWKIRIGPSVSPGDFGDPVLGTPTLGVCLYDGSPLPQPLVAAALPAGGTCDGRPCWRSLGGPGGYRYKNRLGQPGGLTDVKLKAGELQLVVKGRGATLPLPTLGLRLPVTVQLVIVDGSETACWQAVFASSLRNDATLFKAKQP